MPSVKIHPRGVEFACLSLGHVPYDILTPHPPTKKKRNHVWAEGGGEY